MPDVIVVDQMVKAPGRCTTCGNTGRAIDTGVEHPLPGGAIYVCAVCVGHWAGLLGWASPEQTATERESFEALRSSYVDASNELEGLRAKPALDAEATMRWIEAHRPGPKPKAPA